MSHTLSELAQAVGGRHAGSDARIERVAPLSAAGAGDLTFVTEAALLERFLASNAAAAVVPEGAEIGERAVIFHANPYAAIAEISELLSPEAEQDPGVSELAVVHATARLGEDVRIGPFAMIGPGVELADGVRVAERVSIGADCSVGAGTRLDPGAVLYARVTLGAACRVFSGAVIGAPGYGYVPDGEGHRFVPQRGGVTIGDHVDVGACACIDAGTFEPTRIGNHVKIDDLVMVGHNCRVGDRSLLCGQVGLAGSSIVEEDVTLAGQVGVGGHMTVGKGVIATAQAGIVGDVAAGSVVAGHPAIHRPTWQRASVTFAKLPELRRELRELQRRIAELEERS